MHIIYRLKIVDPETIYKTFFEHWNVYFHHGHIIQYAFQYPFEPFFTIEGRSFQKMLVKKTSKNFAHVFKTNIVLDA